MKTFILEDIKNMKALQNAFVDTLKEESKETKKVIKLSSELGKEINAKHVKLPSNYGVPHSRKRDYGVPIERPCGFPSASTNIAKSNGKANPHPLKLWKFKSTSKALAKKHN